MAVFPIDMALLPVFSPAFCFQNMQPHIQVGLCLIARSQNYTNLPDSWICGRLRVFADFYGRFAGNFGRSYVYLYIYMRWCLGYENGLVCSWDAARMHAIFNHIQSYSKFQLRK
jgi:hypothetical protein